MITPRLRKFVRAMHVWPGLAGGIFICLMGFTGGLVALRPQIATLLSPAPAQVATCVAPDWNRAAQEITAYAHSPVNRIYGPYGSDTRYHFRIATDRPIIFHHVIYDACSGRIHGSINMAWMDWTVDLHRALGLFAACLLLLESFTGLWLAFPQTMRGMLAMAGPVEENVRPSRRPKQAGESAPSAGRGKWIAAAHNAIPDGVVREIRLPEGNGNVQIRMWRPGDFRSPGNNVVFVSSSGSVLAVDRDADRASSNRIVQAMAALHYDEWGGLPLRLLAAFAGLVTPLLFITGTMIWWHSRRRVRAAPTHQPAAVLAL
jgi:uncharacterized iron-regulated membrane protein